jgi:hypothetical protein
MTERIATLLNVNSKQNQYVFIICNESPNPSQLARLVIREAHRFADNLGALVRVAQHDPKTRLPEIAAELLAKDWPQPIKDRMQRERDIFVLALRCDFERFNPYRDRWAIIWPSGLRNISKRVPRLFDRLFRAIHQERRDLFELFEAVVEHKDGSIPATIISTLTHIVPECIAVKRGRVGILDPSLSVREYVRCLKANGRFRTRPRGWKAELARAVQTYLADGGHEFDFRSVRDALKDGGIFAEFGTS